MKLSRIVCATDFSAASQAALSQAAALAEWERAELHVISVGLDTNSAYRGGPRGAGASDPAAQAIVQTAYEIRADLVVVGTTVPHAGIRGRGWLAESVAYEADCPTLIVPSELAPTPGHLPFKNILCPVDFSPGSVVALHSALYLAQRAEGALTLVHVLDGTEEEGAMQTRWNPPPDESMRGGHALSRMWSAIPDDALNWCKIDAHVTAGSPTVRIAATAAGVNADLIVMGVTARGLFGGSTAGSILRGVAADSTCPILVPRGPTHAAAWDQGYLSETIWKQRRAAFHYQHG
jgi:nucleotide-binding universal stress UspA family protein